MYGLNLISHVRRWVWWVMLATLAGIAGDGPKFSQNETCMDCHEDEVGSLHATTHIPVFDVSCQDCHVEYEAHVEDEDNEVSIPRGEVGLDVCMSCHESDIHSSRWGDDIHQSAQIYCDDCHSSHDTKQSSFPNLAAPQDELCLGCHSELRAQFAKPYAHQIEGGAMTCSSCHDPHGTRAEMGLKQGRAGDGPCLSCHTEKRGPFVFEHVTGITGDCMSCHEYHGSSNPRQLTRARVDQVCRECHSGLPMTTLGSQPPATHNLMSPRYRDCTVCHAAIHGSSRSPALLK